MRCWIISIPVFLPIAILIGCAATEPTSYVHESYPDIELTEDAIEIAPDTGIWDTPVLSPDGRRLATQIELYHDPVLPYEIYSLGVTEKDASGQWKPLRIIHDGVYKKCLGRMSQPIQPGFDPSGERLYFAYIELDSILSIPFAWSVRSWIERMPFAGGESERLIAPDDYDLTSTELIQHARVSPDGRWLSFYVRVHIPDQGVYLYDLKTGAKRRLSAEHDKHPTWSPDGKRHRFDFFSSGLETSTLGFYELSFEDGELESWERMLMDPQDEGFIYNKHATVVAGTDLLFCHGRRKPEAKMKLLVRRAEPGSPLYEVKPRWNGAELKAVKHPCSSYASRDLVFIGKPEGEDNYRLLLALTPANLDQIEAIVHGEEGM